MEHFIVICTTLVVSSLIGWRLIRGIDYMDRNYPNYKGEDLFEEKLPNEKKTNKRRKKKKSSN